MMKTPMKKKKIVQNKQTNDKSPVYELDIELFVDHVRQFSVIWNTRLNGFKNYNNKKVLHGTISAVLMNMRVSLCFSIVEAMLLNCLDAFCGLSYTQSDTFPSALFFSEAISGKCSLEKIAPKV